MNIYTENILDHFHHPRHAGRLEAPTATVVEYNPSCGDRVVLDIKLHGKKITSLAFETEGCAISRAALSLLADAIVGKSIDSVRRMTSHDIFELLSIPISPGRTSCALLGLHAVKRALSL